MVNKPHNSLKLPLSDPAWSPTDRHPEAASANDDRALDLPAFSPTPPGRPVPPAPSVTTSPLSPISPEKTGSFSATKRPTRQGSWATLVLGMLGICGTVGALALIWLTTLPPLPECDKISPLSAEVERLYCARQAIQSGQEADLLEGLPLLSNWSASHPLYGEAQGVLEDWSETVLRLAEQKFAGSNFEGAVTLAERIPPESPLYEEAQAAIATWTDQWNRGETIYATAQEALQQQNWDLASAQILELGKLENDYWRIDKADELTRRVWLERNAWNQLTQARKLAGTVDNAAPESLQQAIALLNQIDPQSYAAQEARAERVEWSQLVTLAGLDRWRNGDLDGAIALLKDISPDLVTDPLGQDLVRLSYAQHLITPDDSSWVPSWGQVLALREAIAALQQIQPDSPFHALAQPRLQDWQAQLQDLQQLQMANLVASLGHQATYELAMTQAQTIGSDRPRRLQAQTLIAHWRNEIERIEDQPILAQAEQFAALGTIPDLQQAIQIATFVPEGRALWTDAQTAMQRWQQQIQVIEDRPLLEEAQTLAEAGQLPEAIRAAGRIRRDRALYAEAQAAIEIWRNKIREIQIAADQPILDEAYALAAQERLTLAIEKAAQIGRGRALYADAQAAIAQWEAQRAAIWAEWETEATEPDPYSEDSGWGTGDRAPVNSAPTNGSDYDAY